MKITYRGPHDRVEITDLGMSCAQGESIDVDDDRGAEMCRQHDWEAAQTKHAAKAADKES